MLVKTPNQPGLLTWPGVLEKQVTSPSGRWKILWNIKSFIWHILYYNFRYRASSENPLTINRRLHIYSKARSFDCRNNWKSIQRLHDSRPLHRFKNYWIPSRVYIFELFTSALQNFNVSRSIGAYHLENCDLNYKTAEFTVLSVEDL